MFEANKFIEVLSSMRSGGADLEARIYSLQSMLAASARARIVNSQILEFFIDCLLRINSNYCMLAGPVIREWIKFDILNIESALNILANWEKHPVWGFEPNLGATVYEHLFEREDTKKLFLKWKENIHLRKRLIEVAYCLPINEELELYEFGISVGEKESVRSSLETFLSVREIPSNANLQARLKLVLSAVSLQLPPSPPTSPPDAPLGSDPKTPSSGSRE